GEISSEDSLATTAEYVNPRRLHMGYSFELLTNDFSAAYIRGTVERLEAAMTDGWPCWAVSNHDVQRAVTRWGGANPGPDFARMLVALVCSLRGSVCLYQGEELGLPEAEVPFEALQDPYGVAFWPNFKGRDGCRTPMPWDGEPLAGFTAGTPWLPVPAEHRALRVQAQDADAGSVLNAVRAFLRWRRGQSALVHGSIRFIDASAPLLAFVRESQTQCVVAVFNLSNEPATFPLPPELCAAATLEIASLPHCVAGCGGVELPPHRAWLGALGADAQGGVSARGRGRRCAGIRMQDGPGAAHHAYHSPGQPHNRRRTVGVFRNSIPSGGDNVETRTQPVERGAGIRHRAGSRQCARTDRRRAGGPAGGRRSGRAGDGGGDRHPSRHRGRHLHQARSDVDRRSDFGRGH